MDAFGAKIGCEALHRTSDCAASLLMTAYVRWYFSLAGQTMPVKMGQVIREFKVWRCLQIVLLDM